jgi:hypothetical protein
MENSKPDVQFFKDLLKQSAFFSNHEVKIPAGKIVAREE